jgi:Lon protease-like protein
MSTDPIPESWPPKESVVRRVAPMFPLPDVWLFPYLVLPLRIFEDRYKQMIEDSLDGPGRIVMATIQEGHEKEVEGAPPVHHVAGLGEIGRHERKENGEFSIVLVGVQRVLVNEIESDHPYRLAEIEPAPETPVLAEREKELRAELVGAILDRVQKPITVPDQIPTSHLVDLLTLHMPLPHKTMSRLFSEFDLEKRARGALEQHEIRPKIAPIEPESDPGGEYRGGQAGGQGQEEGEDE